MSGGAVGASEAADENPTGKECKDVSIFFIAMVMML